MARREPARQKRRQQMQQNGQFVALDPMTSRALHLRGARGIHSKSAVVQHFPREKSSTILPGYLDADEVRVILAAAPHARAKLLILTQWRAGLRVSEALALTRADLSLGSNRPALRVRNGKGRKAGTVPVHPQLQTALASVLEFADIGDGPIIVADRSTAWSWVRKAQRRAVELSGLASGRRVGTHTLRHSYGRHLLLNGIPLNHLSRWLCHSKIETTLIYLDLVPDTTGSLVDVPLWL